MTHAILAIIAGLATLELCGVVLAVSLCRAAARRPLFGPSLAAIKESSS